MSDSSRIIRLNGGPYDFTLPKLPDKETDIWYHNLKKSDQYWKSPANKDFRWLNPDNSIKDVRKMSERDKTNYIHYWRDKWENGLWIMLEGEPVWLSGLHMEHLIFNTYNSSKLEFYDDERNVFYFIEMTEPDPTCTGRTWVKPRRIKMTTIMCSLCQRKILSDFSNYVVIQSNTLDKAQKNYMNPIIDSYVKRPFWMREEYYAPNGKKPRKSLELRANVINKEESDEPMGGTINIYPALPNATDGLEAVEAVQDEFSKVEDVSPLEMFEVNKKVLQTFRKKGMSDCLSSTGDSKDAAKATMDWHKLIANSNPNHKDQYGRTPSGNWEYFINAIHSQYVPKEFTNKFGKVDKARAEEWIWNEHNKFQKGSREYIFSLYKLPLVKEHALLSSATTNLFRKPAIIDRLSYLDGLLPDEKPYIRGNLEENNSGTIVTFVPNPEGIWLWAVQPYFSIERNIDTRNRFSVSNGIYYPPVNPEGCIGYDPIVYPKAVLRSSNFSQACLVIHKKHDYYNKPDSKDYCADEKMAFLLWRPDDPHDVNKEAMKAAKFTGYPVSHERSVAHVYEDFRDNNMLPFLLQFDGNYGIISGSNHKNTTDGVAMLQARYRAPQSPQEKDQIACHPFEDCLRSHRDFDPSNTTAFDPTMAEIMCEHGLKQIPYTNMTDISVHQMMNRIHEVVVPRRHLANR